MNFILKTCCRGCDALLEDLQRTCKTILVPAILVLYQFSNAVQIDRRSTAITDLKTLTISAIYSPDENWAYCASRPFPTPVHYLVYHSTTCIHLAGSCQRRCDRCKRNQTTASEHCHSVQTLRTANYSMDLDSHTETTEHWDCRSATGNENPLPRVEVGITDWRRAVPEVTQSVVETPVEVRKCSEVEMDCCSTAYDKTPVPLRRQNAA